jgi:hypothetical protein
MSDLVADEKVSFFCFRTAHELCGDWYPLALYFHRQLGTWVCECTCHETSELGVGEADDE